MKVTLYSTGCPQCKVLKQKLDEAGVEYNIIGDIDLMLSKGLTAAPVLEVDGEMMSFKQACDWLKASAVADGCASCKL